MAVLHWFYCTAFGAIYNIFHTSFQEILNVWSPVRLVNINVAFPCSIDSFEGILLEQALLPGCDFIVKSGNFGHLINSDIHLQTEEIQIRRILMKQSHCPNLADRPNFPDFT